MNSSDLYNLEPFEWCLIKSCCTATSGQKRPFFNRLVQFVPYHLIPKFYHKKSGFHLVIIFYSKIFHVVATPWTKFFGIFEKKVEKINPWECDAIVSYLWLCCLMGSDRNRNTFLQNISRSPWVEKLFLSLRVMKLYFQFLVEGIQDNIIW